MGKTPSSRESPKIKVVYGMELGDLEGAIQKAIAYRGFELYQRRGGSHGHDLEDWFRAENELIKPGGIQITDGGKEWVIQGDVGEFGAGEIRVGVSASKLIVWGQLPQPGTPPERSTMLGEITLPSEVNPEQARATLKGNVLLLKVPKKLSDPASVSKAK